MASFTKYKKGDATYWQFRCYLGTDEKTGRRISTTRRGFKTERGAKQAYKKLLVDYEKNGGLAPKKTVKIQTFEELYQLWLEGYKTTVKESSLKETKKLFKNHILVAFGKYKLTAITIPQAQKAVNKWAKELKNYSSLVSYCSRLMKYAISLELAEKNPFEYVERPKAKEKREKKEFYTKEELEIVLNHFEDATQSDDELERHEAYFYYCLIRVLAFTGLRISEALALEWNDIDFSKNTLSVTKTIFTTEDNIIKTSTPKTRASIRTLPIDAKTMSILKCWRLLHKQVLFTNGKKSEIVFSDIEGAYLAYHIIFHSLQTRFETCEMPFVHFHGYRHTHASLLFASGATMKEVQVRLGHSDIKTTMNVYTHVTNNQLEQTVEKLTQFASF